LLLFLSLVAAAPCQTFAGGFFGLRKTGVQFFDARGGKFWKAARRSPLPLPIGMKPKTFDELMEVVLSNPAFADVDGIALYGSRTHFRGGYLPYSTSDLDVRTYSRLFVPENSPAYEGAMHAVLDRRDLVNEALSPVAMRAGFQIAEEVPSFGNSFRSAIRGDTGGLPLHGYPQGARGTLAELQNWRALDRWAKNNPQLGRDFIKNKASQEIARSGMNPGRQAVIIVRAGPISEYVDELVRAGFPHIVVPR